MKVGTDGCLLGAWADTDAPQHILDIGAGTGLVSLMLAQRFLNAEMDAVEIGKTCAEQCAENVSASPWAARITTHNCAIQDFKAEKNYDLIVCNPPFFSNAFAAPSAERHTARHDDSLSVDDLFSAAKRLLSSKGKFCLVIPVDREADFTSTAAEKKLFFQQKVVVKPTPTKAAKRLLLSFSTTNSPLQDAELLVEKSRGIYSQDFSKLLSPFYLYL